MNLYPGVYLAVIIYYSSVLLAIIYLNTVLIALVHLINPEGVVMELNFSVIMAA